MGTSGNGEAHSRGEMPADFVRNATPVAVEVIREAILSGRIQPGERLKEAGLARELGLSRTPVREALLVLQAEGLIDTFPNKGAVVPEKSASDLLGIYELRALLEGHACRLAARRIQAEEVVWLEESCDRFDALPENDVQGSVEENLAFHQMILRAARNPRLEQMARSVTELPLVYRTYVWRNSLQRNRSSAAHRGIVAAVSEGDDFRAELSMREHVLSAGDLLAAEIREAEDDAEAEGR